MEKTKKSGKSKKDEKAKKTLNLFLFAFHVSPCNHHCICRKEEGDVDASLHNFGKNGNFDPESPFGPGSKGPST